MPLNRLHCILSIFCIASIAFFAARNLVVSFVRSQSSSKTLKAYSYISDDYPELYPMDDLKSVLMTVEETVNYPLDGPVALTDWASNAPKGYGYVRLGANRRTLCVSMFHQLHCLRLIRVALTDPTHPLSSKYHSQHCLNYIRQMVLCNPDLTLEPFNPLTRNFTVERVGATHVCRNWGAVYDEMARNWDEWQIFWNKSSESS